MLGEVDLIAAEDTRTTRKLLTRHDLHVRLVSLFDANARRRIPLLLKELGEGKSIALVSEAGTPLISDPGAQLVSVVAEAGHTVTPRCYRWRGCRRTSSRFSDSCRGGQGSVGG